MYKYIVFLLFLLISLNSCTKEESISVLKDTYEPTVRETEDSGLDFIVNLQARALQNGEKGEWEILNGEILDNYVFFEDKNNPFTRFKGLPGEEYVLEWKRWDVGGNASTIETKIVIPQPKIEILEATPSNFETIRILTVDPKYRGTWSFDKPYGHLASRYHDGRADPIENKPLIELHGYANTSYTATFTYIYAGKELKFYKTVQTGDYTQDEGLYELNLSRGTTRIIEDRDGNILELNLQAEGKAWIFNEPESYPALKSFKMLRKLILGGSTLKQIPTLLGDAYTNLEDLSMDRIGQYLVFPENFGNLTKLKTLLVSPLYTPSNGYRVILPKSFANLKSLEVINASSIGIIDFNGILGELTNLKTLSAVVKEIPVNIGELKQLSFINFLVESAAIPQELSNCTGLIFLKLRFLDKKGSKIFLPNDIGNLKKLETFEIATEMLTELPASFTKLAALKKLDLDEIRLDAIPEELGDLSNLEILSLYGEFTRLPNSFGDLTKLTDFILRGKVEALPENFGNLSSLVYFNAENTPIKTLPESFGKLKKLEQMIFTNCKLEYLPASFGELDALHRLFLAYNKLATFPKSIIPLKSIKTVYFYGNHVGDIPDEISLMKPGVIFYLNQVPNLTLERMNHVVSISKGKIFYTDLGYFSSAP